MPGYLVPATIVDQNTEIGGINLYDSITFNNLMTIQMERSGGFTGGTGQLAAFGNGAADGYMSFPFDVDLVYASMRVNATHTGTTVVQFNINGTAQGTSYQLTCSGASSNASGDYSSIPKRVTSGQGINFSCVSISGTLGTTVINAIFKKVV